jgi:hypothetical protein
MRHCSVLILPLTMLLLIMCACAPSRPAASTQPASRPSSQPAVPAPEPNAHQTLHVRLVLNPATGDVAYFGWYDGRRTLLGPGGITTAIVGNPPPELRGSLQRAGDGELLYHGIDENQIAWTKRYRLVDDHTVAVTHTIQNRGDRAFDAILYSLADLPDATISGDNRDQRIRSPIANAHFHADISDPHFPGEQMNPSALRSDSTRLEPGDSLTFRMTWLLEVARAPRP